MKWAQWQCIFFKFLNKHLSKDWIIRSMLLSFVVLKWILKFSFLCFIVLEFLFFVIKWKCIHGNWKWKTQNELEMHSCFWQCNKSEISFKLCYYLLGAFTIRVPQHESWHLFVLFSESWSKDSIKWMLWNVKHHY